MYNENLETLVSSNDPEERQAAFKKLQMYDAHLADLAKEVPSDEMIDWWEELQRDITEVYAPFIMDEPKDYTPVISRFSSHHAKVQEMFKGKKCELLVTSSFLFHAADTNKVLNEYTFHYGLSTMLQRLSDALNNVYGLEPLDIPRFTIYYE